MLKKIYKSLGVRQLRDRIQGDTPYALNTLPWHRQEVVQLGRSGFVASGSHNLISLRPLEVAVEEENPVTVKEASTGVFVLENAQLRVQVENGCITSLYDRREKREVIAEGGKANQFVIFDDKPLYWQAWDVEVYHLDTRKELSSGATTIAEDGPYRVSVVTETKISELSSIRTTISLLAAVGDEPSSVEVTADVDWHETMKFLKVEFPVDVRATEASYETQFGVVRRPTHYNTSWDMAKFEVCCHKFADLSEHAYGVSILNDSKYGFATVGHLMRLSLLRSPKAPDAHADMGSHTIRWSVFPHAGALGPATVRKAFELNNPLQVVMAKERYKSPVHLTGDAALVLDTVKRGEDDEDVSTSETLPRRKGRSVVLRIYDSLGGRARGAVETAWDIKRVCKTNLLEDELEEVKFQDGRFEIELRPFEVATYRLQL